MNFAFSEKYIQNYRKHNAAEGIFVENIYRKGLVYLN